MMLGSALAQVPLEAIFTASVIEGEAPLEVTFDATASLGPADLGYEWRFGDGNRAEGATVTQTFEKLGEFGVILTVRSGERWDTETQIITVRGDGPSVVVQIPFTVNEDELKGAGKVVSIYGPAYLESATTVPIPYRENGEFEFVRLVSKNDNAVVFGIDFFYGGFKETFTFDAVHIAKAAILNSMAALQMPDEDFPKFYDQIEDHPRFHEVVDAVLSAGGLFLDPCIISEEEEALGSLISDIGYEVAQKLYEDKGILEPSPEDNP